MLNEPLLAFWNLSLYKYKLANKTDFKSSGEWRWFRRRFAFLSLVESLVYIYILFKKKTNAFLKKPTFTDLSLNGTDIIWLTFMHNFDA